MKAKQIKKLLLDKYKESTERYEMVESLNVRDMAMRQAKIKQLESILLTCFGVGKTFNFNFVYKRDDVK